MAEGAKDTATDVYLLETGDFAAERLRLLDSAYGPATRLMLLDAGLCAQTRALDLACGIGVVFCFMASVVGSKGSLAVVDVNPDQLVVAKSHCAKCEHEYIEASAYETGLPSASFDLVHIRFLLCHLNYPAEALREVSRLLKPGGRLVCQDIRISSVFCSPDKGVFEQSVRIAHETGKALGVNYDYGVRMPLDVIDVAFQIPEVRSIQPAYLQGPQKRLWELSCREAMATIVKCDVNSEKVLTTLFEQMRMVAEDDKTLIGQWGMLSVTAVK